MSNTIIKEISSVPYGLFHYSEKELNRYGEVIAGMSINLMSLVVPVRNPETSELTLKTQQLIIGYVCDGDFDDVWYKDAGGLNVEDIWNIKVIKSGDKLLGHGGTRLDCLIKTETRLNKEGPSVPGNQHQHLLCIKFTHGMVPPFIELMTVDGALDLERYKDAATVTGFDKRMGFGVSVVK